jgi:chemotaxis methyl-accepting protein methylase
MISVGESSLGAYLQRLRADAEEASRLLERLTIKVSRFYRNARTFDFLMSEVIPTLAKMCDGAPLRVWSAGCGCGEEAYTLAMLLDRAGVAGTVEATDIDPAALAFARVGIYRAEALAELPQYLAGAYLEPLEGKGESRYRVGDALRERVHFSHHDLTAVAPHTGASFDLVCCRNVLIYLGRDAQQHAFEILNVALRNGGFLCIGEAEWPLPEVSDDLASQGCQTQVFRRVVRGERTER